MEPPPPEPRLQAAAGVLLPGRLTGAQLGELEAGWSAHLQDEPDMGAVGERGVTLFRLGARLLGIAAGHDLTDGPGRLYASVDAARRGLADLDTSLAGQCFAPVASRARPLTALAALAARDLRRGGPPFEPEVTPGRSWTLLRHRLTGTI